MRILLDESAPRRLKDLLAPHEVTTAQEQGWTSRRNGDLLGLAAAAGFDVLVTPDQSLSFQQNLSTFEIAVVVLAAPGGNRMSSYLPIAAALLAAVETARKREALVVTG